MTAMKNTSRTKQLTHSAWVFIAPALLFLMLLANNSLRADNQPDRTIVVLGDSISAAYGISTADGWVALLQKKVEDEDLNMTVVNASVTGDTTANGLSRLPNLLEEYQPAMVIIELGGNDGLRGLSPKKLKENLAQMATMASENGAEVVIVSVQLPDNYGGAYNKLFTRAFVTAAETTQSAIVTALFKGFDASAKWFQSDGIHPSVLAQPVMLDNIWEVAKGTLEQIASQ